MNGARKLRHEKQLVALRYWLLGHGYTDAVRAMNYASQYHTGTRKDQITPEFEHQVSIALYIRSISSGLMHPEKTLIAAFLHDVPEDYNVPFPEISNLFGLDMSQTIGLLTKKYKGGPRDQKTYFEDIAGCPIASVVKGIDRIHNIQTIPYVFTFGKQKDYITEAETFILPMLKTARRNFPEQDCAYENIKNVLESQIDLIKAIHTAKESRHG